MDRNNFVLSTKIEVIRHEKVSVKFSTSASLRLASSKPCMKVWSSFDSWVQSDLALVIVIYIDPEI